MEGLGVRVKVLFVWWGTWLWVLDDFWVDDGVAGQAQRDLRALGYVDWGIWLSAAGQDSGDASRDGLIVVSGISV